MHLPLSCVALPETWLLGRQMPSPRVWEGARCVQAPPFRQRLRFHVYTSADVLSCLHIAAGQAWFQAEPAGTTTTCVHCGGSMTLVVQARGSGLLLFNFGRTKTANAEAAHRLRRRMHRSAKPPAVKAFPSAPCCCLRVLQSPAETAPRAGAPCACRCLSSTTQRCPPTHSLATGK